MDVECLVGIETGAARALIKMDRLVQQRIARAVEALRVDPRPPGCVKLSGVGSDAYRIRIGDHRVVYVVDDARREVTVTLVGNRRDVYRRL